MIEPLSIYAPVITGSVDIGEVLLDLREQPLVMDEPWQQLQSVAKSFHEYLSEATFLTGKDVD